MCKKGLTLGAPPHELDTILGELGRDLEEFLDGFGHCARWSGTYRGRKEKKKFNAESRKLLAGSRWLVRKERSVLLSCEEWPGGEVNVRREVEAEWEMCSHREGRGRWHRHKSGIKCQRVSYQPQGSTPGPVRKRSVQASFVNQAPKPQSTRTSPLIDQLLHRFSSNDTSVVQLPLQHLTIKHSFSILLRATEDSRVIGVGAILRQHL